MIDLEDKELIKEDLALAAADTRAYAELFYPPEESPRFRRSFSTLHETIFEYIDSPWPKTLVLAPRGIGKTNILRAYAERKIVNRQCHYLVYVSKSLTHAERQTENIKHDLLTNKRIRKIYGSIKIKDYEDEDNDIEEQFSKKAWVAYGSVLVQPLGSGQQIRGSNWRNYRPDVIIVDDYEDEDTINNEDIRADRLDWILASLQNCVDVSGDDWEIRYIDTLRHEDATPVHLMEMPSWRCVSLSVCDDDYNTFDPEFKTNEQILEEIEEATQMGKLDLWYREMRNRATAPETASFKREYFRYYTESSLSPLDLQEMESVVLVDPAKTVKPQSDWSAVMGVGFSESRRCIYLRDIFAGMVYPDDLYEAIVNMCLRLGTSRIGLEVTSLNEFITYPFYNFLSSKGLDYFEVTELKAVSKKEERIKTLMAPYKLGQVYHNSELKQIGEYEGQLLSFDRGRRDDMIDAMAYLSRYFSLGSMWIPREPNETEQILRQIGPGAQTWDYNEAYERAMDEEILAAIEEADWELV